jgi:hypothetical protein
MTSIHTIRDSYSRGLTPRRVVVRDPIYRNFRCMSFQGRITIRDGVSIIGFRDVRRPDFRYVGKYALDRTDVAYI